MVVTEIASPVTVSWVVNKGDGAMPKIGDRFKDKTTGKIYVVKLVDKEEVVLEGEEGLGRRLASVAVLKRTCEKLEDTKS